MAPSVGRPPSIRAAGALPARLPDITVSRLPELLPWNWKLGQETVNAA